jgi:hypothetical protein
MKPLPGWKRLLLQALEKTPLDGGSGGRFDRWNPLPALAWRERALAEAGILNRPFPGRLRVIHAWWIARGQPEPFRHHCLQAVIQAQPGPSRKYLLSATALLLPLALTLLPKAATTSISPEPDPAVLKRPRITGGDHEGHSVALPLDSDYLLAAMDDVPDAFYRAGLHQLEWLQQRPAGAHGLQLISASHPENLIRFCRQHRICGSSVVIESQMNGRRIWRLLLGDYPDRPTARQAIAQLPAALRKLGPWPRRYALLLDETAAGN